MKKDKTIKKAWLVLDVGGGLKHPSVSVFDTKKEAIKEAKKLNALPNPTDIKDPKNYVIKCEIHYKFNKAKARKEK